MTEEALARKNSVRAAYRSSATRLMNLIGATLIDADELVLLQTNLSTKLTRLETLNTDIVELTPEAQLEEEIGEQMSTLRRYGERCCWLARLSPRVPSPRDTT